jgi:hypothetical protein
MNSAFFGLPWTLWGVLALLVAGLYIVVWPRSSNLARPRPVWRHLVLQWSHALVWALLALSCFIRADLLPGESSTANAAALLALAVYATFLGTLALDRRSGRRHGSCEDHRNG